MLVIMITASLDFSAILGQFGQLEEAIHDGVRYASAISSLETGQFQGLSAGSGPSCPSLGSSPLHQLLQDRVVELIKTNSRNLDLNTVCINSLVQISPNGGRTLRLRITVNYNGVFPGAASLPLNVEATGPIL